MKGLAHNCLYFTANALARQMSQLADEAFVRTGLSPSHAILLLHILEEPGATQKELAEAVHLNPSTITRFVDTLQTKGLVTRHPEGKATHHHPTPAGKKLAGTIQEAWQALYERYSALLGEDEGKRLNRAIDQANRKLSSP